MDIRIRLKDKYIKDLKNKGINTSVLGKLLNYDLASNLLKGEPINMTLKNFYKLCELADWNFPDYFDVFEE